MTRFESGKGEKEKLPRSAGFVDKKAQIGIRIEIEIDEVRIALRHEVPRWSIGLVQITN